MRLQLDECLPRALKRLPVGREVRTVQEMQWAGRRNGDLLQLAEPLFDALITVDANIRYQQNLRGRRISIVLLAAPRNTVEELGVLVPAVLVELESLGPGEVVRVSA